MKKLVIIDRDGTLNHNDRSKDGGPYHTLKPEQFEWIAGAQEGLGLLAAQPDIIMHILTSQDCIRQGLVTKEEVDLIHKKLNDDLEQSFGIRIPITIVYGPTEQEKIMIKTEAMQDILAEYTINQGIEIGEIWSIGDTEEDILAGNMIRSSTIHVELEHTREKDKYVKEAKYHVKSFRDAVDIIIGK